MWVDRKVDGGRAMAGMTRWMVFFGVFGLAGATACSGSVAPLGPGPDGGGTGTCSTDGDCGVGRVCGFLAADACTAKGTCFDSPAQGTPQCHAYTPGCACDGTEVNLACNGYPSGYAS